MKIATWPNCVFRNAKQEEHWKLKPKNLQTSATSATSRMAMAKIYMQQQGHGILLVQQTAGKVKYQTTPTQPVLVLLSAVITHKYYSVAYPLTRDAQELETTVSKRAFILE